MTTVDQVYAYNNFVLVEKADVKQETDSGLAIPASVQRNNEWWKVLSVGPECTKNGYFENGVPTSLKVGDLVRPHSTIDIYVEGKAFKVVPDNNVMCVRPGGGEKIKAFKNHVLIESTIDSSGTTPSGLVIPESARKVEFSRVLSVGAACQKGYLNGEELKQIKSEDRIQYHKGLTVKMGEREYVAVPEDHVMLVVPA